MVLVALAVAWAWVLADVRCAWAEDADSTIPVQVRMFQEYKVTTSGLQNTFEYLIEPSEEDAPLPLDADGKTLRSFKLTRDQELWLTFPIPIAISPSAEHITYHYVLRPAETSLSDGLYYVDLQSTNLVAGVNVYYLDIDVVLSNKDLSSALVVPTVHIEDFDGPKVTDPGWRIAYKEQGGSTDQDDAKTASSTTTKTTSGTTSSTGASGSLSKTGDQFDGALAAELASTGIMLMLVGLSSLYRRRRGECNA